MQRLVLGLVVAVGVSAVGCSNKNNRRADKVGEVRPAAPPGRGREPAAAPPSTVNSVYERNNHPSRDGHFPAADADQGGGGDDGDRQRPSPPPSPAAPGRRRSISRTDPAAKASSSSSPTATTCSRSTRRRARRSGRATSARRPGSSGAGCGDILPIGIISTPVIDPQTRTIYVAGAIGNTTTITAHQIHALSPDDGSERAGLAGRRHRHDLGQRRPSRRRRRTSAARCRWSAASSTSPTAATTATAATIAAGSSRSTSPTRRSAAPGSPAARAAKGSGPRAAWPPTETASSRSPATTSRARRPTPTAKRSCA